MNLAPVSVVNLTKFIPEPTANVGSPSENARWQSSPTDSTASSPGDSCSRPG
jgi:hypothetical protein